MFIALNSLIGMLKLNIITAYQGRASLNLAGNNLFVARLQVSTVLISKVLLSAGILRCLEPTSANLLKMKLLIIA